MAKTYKSKPKEANFSSSEKRAYWTGYGFISGLRTADTEDKLDVRDVMSKMSLKETNSFSKGWDKAAKLSGETIGNPFSA